MTPQNPYAPPHELSQRTDQVCNFCGQSPQGKPLVQAPNQDVYICGPCARTAADMADAAKTKTDISSWFSAAVAAVLIVLVPLNWFVWHDEAGLGLKGSLLGLLMAAVCLGHVAIALAGRAWARNS